MKTQWTLTALYDQMHNDLALCQTTHERIICAAICKKEIRDAAVKIQKIRKLSPGEISVLLSI